MDARSFEARAAALPKLAELQARFGPQRDVNAEQQQGFSRLERLAIFVTDNVGTMGFFFIIAAWTGFWLGWNVWGPVELRFDPGPAFVLWLFISNLIQLHLMPLIMVGQNLQDRYAELRAQADFEVNQKAEAEVEAVLRHLANQDEIMIEILRRIEGLERPRSA
jgi:uncharacterized membrane protein